MKRRRIRYDVRVQAQGGGTAGANALLAKPGETVDIWAEADPGKAFVRWSSTSLPNFAFAFSNGKYEGSFTVPDRTSASTRSLPTGSAPLR